MQCSRDAAQAAAPVIGQDLGKQFSSSADNPHVTASYTTGCGQAEWAVPCASDARSGPDLRPAAAAGVPMPIGQGPTPAGPASPPTRRELTQGPAAGGSSGAPPRRHAARTCPQRRPAAQGGAGAAQGGPGHAPHLPRAASAASHARTSSIAWEWTRGSGSSHSKTLLNVLR